MKINSITSRISLQGLVFLLLFSYSFGFSKYFEEEKSGPQQELLQQKDRQINEKKLSRQRRFLAFPYGSSFSASICTTIGMYGNPNVNWISYALNFGVSYNLPNETWVVDSAHGFDNLKVDDNSSSSSSSTSESKAEMIEKRRTRRDLYYRIETIIDRIGFNGRQCILRTLCEVSKYFIGSKGTMVEELLKTIFSYPGRRSFTKRELFNRYHHSDFMYQNAFQTGQNLDSLDNCLYYFPNCSFSIVDLAFGKYSVRPTTLMKKNDFFSFM